MSSTPRVSTELAKQLVEREGYVVLDVRSTPEFIAEHPAGAYNIPLLHKQSYGMVANPDFSRVVEASFPDKTTRILTTCGMGGRSLRAAAELIARGYQHVVDLHGGFEGERNDAGELVAQGWKEAGLPTETGEPKGRAYVELYARLTPKSAPPASQAAAPQAAAPSMGNLNRYADPKHLVDCVKLGARLPGLKRKPLGGALGDRVFSSISAEAWAQWAEHSKLIINENRLNPADPKAQELLLQQCEVFLFGGGVAEKPKEFKPV